MKNIVLIFSIFILSILLVGTAYILKNKEICCDYELCIHLTDLCNPENEEEEGTVLISDKGIPITLENLDSGESVKTGTEIRGSVAGNWYWEGVFPVLVIDREGNQLATLMAQAQTDTYTSDIISFAFPLDVEVEEDSVVILKFEKSNPSSLEENDDYAQMSITIQPDNEDEVNTQKVKIFFPNDTINSEMLDCSLVFPVTREIPETLAVGRASINELLEGPTEEEIEEGYFTNIPEGVEILSITVEEGVATIDFNSLLEEGVGGSCRVNSIRAQIEETLKQFSTVDSVVISIDGRTEDILQP